MSLSKEQIVLEYVKCVKDTPYALSTYLQTYDNTVSKYVPLELFPDQITLLEDYENYLKKWYDHNLVKKKFLPDQDSET